MTIKGFDEKNGKYFIGRYVDYWKSGRYFHKKVHYFKGCKYPDGFYNLSHTENLRYLGHNVEVVYQTHNLFLLAHKEPPICWNDNEY